MRISWPWRCHDVPQLHVLHVHAWAHMQLRNLAWRIQPIQLQWVKCITYSGWTQLNLLIRQGYPDRDILTLLDSMSHVCPHCNPWDTQNELLYIKHQPHSNPLDTQNALLYIRCKLYCNPQDTQNKLLYIMLQPHFNPHDIQQNQLLYTKHQP